MKILQIIAIVKQVMDVINSEQFQQVVQIIQDLIAQFVDKDAAEKFAYVAGRFSTAKYGVAFACPDDCPCTEEERVVVEAELDALTD